LAAPSRRVRPVGGEAVVLLDGTTRGNEPEGHHRVKQRISFMIERELLDRLRSMKSRTGLSDSEQIRRAIRMWLESRQWPPRREAHESSASHD
jgi:hypothetical protein